MNALEEFYKLKDRKSAKIEQYTKEGKTADEISTLLKPDIEEMAEFIREHQTELQESLNSNFKEIIDKYKIDPALAMIMSMMFDSPYFK